jgi:phosphoribosyl 1,2-cyclic phosphate phosphodiesterase
VPWYFGLQKNRVTHEWHMHAAGNTSQGSPPQIPGGNVSTLTLLGTGTSTGVPIILCECHVCTSPDPRDQRLRSSALLQTERATILIDTSPDLRQQMLLARPHRMDAVVFTHAHADHTAGLDELRRYNIVQKERLPVWATPETAHELEDRFGYAFAHTYSFFGGKPDLDLHTFTGTDPIQIAGETLLPIPLNHGRLPIVGFRYRDVAYITDVKTIPEASLPLLQNLDVLVLTALRQTDHPAHMNLAEALETVSLLRPRRAILTHVAHDLGRYTEIAPTLPPSVELGIDGMVIEISPP